VISAVWAGGVTGLTAGQSSKEAARTGCVAPEHLV
jgi:hypothetical protein